MANKGEIQINLNRAALTGINNGILTGISQVFDSDILGEAQERSPVEFGTNRRSIATEVNQQEDGGVLAEIYTQSGYGGYLELGHRVHLKGDAIGEPTGRTVQGRPYLYPAVVNNIPKLLQYVRSNLSVKGGMLK